jgi:hypothetical protein
MLSIRSSQLPVSTKQTKLADSSVSSMTSLTASKHSNTPAGLVALEAHDPGIELQQAVDGLGFGIRGFPAGLTGQPGDVLGDSALGAVHGREDQGVKGDAQSLDDGVSGFEPDAVDIEGQAVRVLLHPLDRLVSIGLVDANRPGGTDTMGMQLCQRPRVSLPSPPNRVAR